MEHKLISFEQYDGWLPKPSKLSGGRIHALEGYPGSVCDGNALDLYGDQEVGFTHKSTNVERILADIQGGKLLSEPRYVHSGDMQLFVLLNTGGEPVAIQTKYYQYFYYRYKGCQFKGTGNANPVGVFHEGKPVGVIMPVAITIDQLPEEGE